MTKHPIRKATSKTFDYSLDFESIDFRKHPELYQVGRGEQGVLLVEPYKSELLPLWRFRTPAIATKSSDALYAQFIAYRDVGDFVGMDMARKFLQMGYTRARRYANHPTGQKYKENPQRTDSKKEEQRLRKKVIPQAADALTNEKAEAARIFYGVYCTAREDPTYKDAKKAHEAKQRILDA